jgi:Bacterial hydrolase
MNEECCPKFDPAPWDRKIFEWKDKRFIQDRIKTFFYVPLTFAKVIRRMNALVETAGASIPDRLCLFDHPSKWNMEVYLAVDREIPGAENVTLNGTFLSKVYEGPYENTGKWMDDFHSYATRQGLEIRKWYVWYTTCPTCSKKYGKNYVAIVAEVSRPSTQPPVI